MPNQSNSSAKSRPSSKPDQNHSDAVCKLLQGIGLPAVRIASSTGEVLSFNELFSFLIDTSALSDWRLWFVEGVVRYFSPADRERWEVALSRRAPTEIHAQLKLSGNQPVDVLMRGTTGIGRRPADQSVVCIFVLLNGPYFEHLRHIWTAEGQESERRRIRNALHQEVAQQFLSAAFGTKLMADKLATVDEKLANEASDLAELLSQATQGLHNVLNPSSPNSR
jgi:signal transduction histidine kinase